MNAVGEAKRGDSALNNQQRDRALDLMRATDPEHPLDVLVIGGGVVGCGAALDAAARGLSVGLVEMQDLAEGTSSRSSRLAHGGLRYLEQREFSLVHEALTERGLLLDRLAPHLVRPVPFLFPVAKQWQRPYVASGIRLYDLLSRVGAYGGSMPRPKSLNREQAKELAPDLNSDEIAGAVRFHDAQIDDARHTVALARTAVSYGAQVVTRARMVSLIRDGDRVVGARIQVEGPEAAGAGSNTVSFAVYARCVIGAVGVWTDQLIHMDNSEAASKVQQSKGVHLVVPAESIRSTTAIIARTAASVLFLLPWGRFWLIGTTDTPWGADAGEGGDPADPEATDADIDYLIEQANRWLARPIRRSDVVATYAGLRPLLAAGNEADETTTLSREHSVFRPSPGLVLIAGGKYTTYRVMAKDVVDAALEDLVNDPSSDTARQFGPSTTEDIPLNGADEYARLWETRPALAAEVGLPVGVVEGLLRRHGDRIVEVLDVIAADPTAAHPLIPDAPYLKAEVAAAVKFAGARTIDDVLTRRLRVTLEVADEGRGAAIAAVPIIAPLLGWSPLVAEQQLADFDSRSRS